MTDLDEIPMVSDRSARIGCAYHALLRRQQRLARLEQLEAPETIIEGERKLVERARASLVALGWDGGAARVHRTPYDLDRAQPPDARRVQQRGLVLAALSERANGEAKGDRQAVDSLQPWAERLDDELEDHERRLLRAPLGTLTTTETANASWLIEGAAALAWALGSYEIPAFDSMCKPHLVRSALGLGDQELPPAALRARSEITAALERIFAIHWRLTDFRMRPTEKPFGELAEGAPFWFGPLATEGLPTATAEGVEDIAIRGSAISLASEEDRDECGSIVVERRRALGWCCGLGASYSDVEMDT